MWQDNFHQDLVDEKRIVIATNKFKPDNIIVGQGYIAAESRNKAIEWLNIVRTALIFVDDNSDDLKRELSSEETKSPEVDEEYEIVRNGHPDGGLAGLGRSPSRMILERVSSLAGSGMGIADSSAWV